MRVLVVVLCLSAQVAAQECPQRRQALDQARSRVASGGTAAEWKALVDAFSNCFPCMTRVETHAVAKEYATANTRAAQAAAIEEKAQEAKAHAAVLEQQRTEVMQKIAQRREEEAAAEARYNAIRSNPRQMAVVFGAIFCAMRDLRTTALAEIAKEKKYARVGGYEDKGKIYGLQQRVRRADEVTDEQRGNIKGFKGLTPAGCSDTRVRAVLACRAVANDTPCEDQLIRDMLTFVPDDEE